VYAGLCVFVATTALTLLIPAATRAENVDQQWVRRYNGPANGDDQATGVAVDKAGNVIVVGVSNNADGSADFYVAKYAAADGALVWEKRTPETTQFMSPAPGGVVTVDSHDNIIVCASQPIGAYSVVGYVAKYAPDGTGLWGNSIGGIFYHVGFANAVAVDGNDDVIIAGGVYDPRDFGNGYNLNYYTVKYAAADGAQIWGERYDGLGGDNDYAVALAVDADGDVVVTGSSQGYAFNAQPLTVAYKGTTGAYRWSQRYGGDISIGGAATAIAVDANGNTAVTGYFHRTQDALEYFTVKYSKFGAQLWEQRVNGAQNDYNDTDVAMDGAGNVLVADSFQTSKYAAADGSLLWRTPMTHGRLHAAIVVDSDSNVIATGASHGFAEDIFSLDYYTVKYAGVDGTIRWDKHYHAPVNGQDLPQGRKPLALTPDGVVVTGGSANETNTDFATVKYGPDIATIAPELRAPATNGISGGTMAVDFFLTEAASDGTVKLTLSGPVATELTLTNLQGTEGEHAFDLAVNDLAASPMVANVVGANALPGGIYTVTLSFQDAAGHPAAAASSANVTVDLTTLPPVLTAPASGSDNVGNALTVAFTLPETALPGSVTLSFGAVELVLAGSEESAGAHTFSFSPARPTASPAVIGGGPIPDGTYAVTLSYRDPFGNPPASDTANEVTVVTVPGYTPLFAGGGAVPGAGVDPRLPVDAAWWRFGVPAIDDDGVVTFRGTWRTPAGVSGSGIFGGEPVALLVAAVGIGGQSLPGVKFLRFEHPVASGGGVAFLATLAGSGVTPLNDTALYHLAGGTLRLIAREGQAMAQVPGSQLKTITAAAVDGDHVLLTGLLRHGPGNVTADNDAGAWLWNGPGTLVQVVRKGTVLTGVSASPVKTFRLLRTVSGTAGAGRGLWHGDAVTFQAAFANGASAIVGTGGLGPTGYYGSGAATVPDLEDARWLAFGPPATPGSAGDGVAFRSGLQPGRGGVTAANATRLFFRGSGTASVARGDAAPGILPGAKFSAFHDPVISPGAVAFAFAGTARLGAAAIPGVWWQRDGGPLQDAVAVLGTPPPGLAPGVTWAQFTSLAATDLGPIFTARLAGASRATNRGLWATDGAGTLHQLLRTGDPLDGKTVASFTALTAAPGSPGVRRSFTGDGRVIVGVLFTDGSVGLVKITLP
jgi:hypothetical protein